MASSTRTSARQRQRTRNIVLSVLLTIIAVIGLIWWVTFATSRGLTAGKAPEPLIPADTTVGVIELNVHDLDSMRAYYEESLTR